MLLPWVYGEGNFADIGKVTNQLTSQQTFWVTQLSHLCSLEAESYLKGVEEKEVREIQAVK